MWPTDRQWRTHHRRDVGKGFRLQVLRLVSCSTWQPRRADSLRNSSSRTMSRRDFSIIFHTHLPFLSDNNFYHNDFSQEGLYKFQSDAIKKAADEGNYVFVGRTADYVLRDYKNVINIFITANIDDRIKAVCKRKNIDRAAARKFIENHDEQRALPRLLYRQEVGNAQRKLRPASTAAIRE